MPFSPRLGGGKGTASPSPPTLSLPLPSLWHLRGLQKPS